MTSLEDSALRAVEMALGKGADACDAFAVRATSLHAGMRLGLPEAIEQSVEAGVGIRIFVGDSYANLSSSDTSDAALNMLIDTAVAMARHAPPDPFARLATKEQWARDIPALDLCDTNPMTMTQLQELARACEDEGRSHAGITNSDGASASWAVSEEAFASSLGASFTQTRSHVSLSLSLIAGSSADMQCDYAYATTRHAEDLPAPESIAREAASRTLAKLNPKKLPSQTMPVIFDPRVGRQLLGAFAGAINGAAIARGTSFLKESMGKAVFAPHITITDNPHLVRGLGSYGCDDEAVHCAPRNMVEAGVLKSWLLDLRSAAQLGLEPTGHGQRSLGGSPHPGSSNLFLSAGTDSPEALLQSFPHAFYVTETFGHGVNLVTGDYSQGASGFLLEKGERVHPVSEVTIAGNLRDMFMQMHPANDLVMRYAINTPTLAIASLSVAGV